MQFGKRYNSDTQPSLSSLTVRSTVNKKDPVASIPSAAGISSHSFDCAFNIFFLLFFFFNMSFQNLKNVTQFRVTFACPALTHPGPLEAFKPCHLLKI